MEKIISAANNKIKLAASLHLRKNRDKLGLFVAEGIRLAEMASSSGWGMEFALVTAEAAKEERAAAIIKDLEARACPVYETSKEIYQKAADTTTPQGLLIVMKKQTAGLNDLCEKTQFLTVLDGIQDAGNAGSIIRTADAVGCSGIVLLKGCVDVFADKTVRSAMGSLFHLPIIDNISATDFLIYCQTNDITIYSAALDRQAESCFVQSYTNKNALVFGNEGNGISQEILDKTKHIYIPMTGGTESLNVAAAAAVVLYQVYQSQQA